MRQNGRFLFGAARLAGASLVAFATGCPNASNDASSASEPPPSGPAWTLRSGLQSTAQHRNGTRLFVYQGPPTLDSGLPGIVEDEGRGPAYGLLSGYFAPRLLAAASSTAAAASSPNGDSLHLALPGLDVTATSPNARTMVFSMKGGGTLVFAADETEVEGRLDGQPSFSTRVTAGGTPGYRAWRADHVFVQTRGKRHYALATSCQRILLIRPVPRGSTSVFLLHIGPTPPPQNPLFMPGAVPKDVLTDQEQCPPTSTSTLTVRLP